MVVSVSGVFARALTRECRPPRDPLNGPFRLLLPLALIIVALAALFRLVPNAPRRRLRRSVVIVGLYTSTTLLAFLFDWTGTRLLAAGFGVATDVFEVLLIINLAALALFAAFVVVELRHERPMVDFSLFRQANFVGTAFAMLGYAGGAQVLIFYLPMFLQNTYGFTPAKAGLAMLPFALPMFVTPRLGARLAMRRPISRKAASGFTPTAWPYSPRKRRAAAATRASPSGSARSL